MRNVASDLRTFTPNSQVYKDMLIKSIIFKTMKVVLSPVNNALMVYTSKFRPQKFWISSNRTWGIFLPNARSAGIEQSLVSPINRP